jgi:hypothetical protein
LTAQAEAQETNIVWAFGIHALASAATSTLAVAAFARRWAII